MTNTPSLVTVNNIFINVRFFSSASALTYTSKNKSRQRLFPDIIQEKASGGPTSIKTVISCKSLVVRFSYNLKLTTYYCSFSFVALRPHLSADLL